jgi:arginine repressor
MSAKKQNEQPESKVEKKSDAVRRIFNSMKERGQEPKPVEVKRRLADEGFEVSAAQISQVLKTLRDGKPAKGRKSIMFSIDDLLAAKTFLSRIGSSEKAKELIDALSNNR